MTDHRSINRLASDICNFIHHFIDVYSYTRPLILTPHQQRPVPSLYNWDHDQVIVPHGLLWMDMNKVSKYAYPKILTCMYVRALQSHLLTDDLLLAYQV